MNHLTHFHSKNVYFYMHYSYSFKIMALSIFQNFWIDTSLKLAKQYRSAFVAFLVGLKSEVQ